MEQPWFDFMALLAHKKTPKSKQLGFVVEKKDQISGTLSKQTEVFACAVFFLRVTAVVEWFSSAAAFMLVSWELFFVPAGLYLCF